MTVSQLSTIHNYSTKTKMYKKKTRKTQATVWRQFTNKGYSAFASLKREVCIGVLSVATLGVAARAEVTLSTRPALPSHSDGDTGEEKDLETVTVAGTLAPLTALQAARIVTVLGRSDIEQAGAQSVNDLLKLAAGVDVRQRGGFGIQTDISIDGGNFDQITILLNGVNISNPHTGHLSSDFPVSISDIERIEVLEGAASRVYGGQSFGGAVNIVTRHSGKNSVEVAAEGGSFGTANAEARGELSKGRWHNSISGGGGRSDGGSANSSWKKGQAFYHGSWEGDALSLSWQTGFSKKAYGANTFYSAAYPDQYERNERYIISVSGETKGKLHLTPQAYWNRTYDNFELVHNNRFGENFHQTDVYGIKVGAHTNWRAGRTAVAADIRQEGILSTSLGQELEEHQYVNVRGEKDIRYTKQDDRTSVSFNLEHNILLERWTVSAGVMANMTTSTDHKYRFYPGIDVAYRPARHWKLFLSYNKGFRLPSFTELYYKSATHTGNKGLKAEVNRSLQVGSQFVSHGISAQARLFYHRGKGMIDWVMYSEDDTYHSAAFDLDNLGAQAQMKMDFPEMTSRDSWVRNLNLGYTYITQTRHDDVNVFKSNYAMEYLRHKFTSTLCHKIVGRLAATWSLRWQDRTGGYIPYGETYIDPATGFLRAEATGTFTKYSAYATLDIKIQWTSPHYELYVKGANVTNRKYYDLACVQQPGAWIMAGARWKM